MQVYAAAVIRNTLLGTHQARIHGQNVLRWQIVFHADHNRSSARGYNGWSNICRSVGGKIDISPKPRGIRQIRVHLLLELLCRQVIKIGAGILAVGRSNRNRNAGGAESRQGRDELPQRGALRKRPDSAFATFEQRQGRSGNQCSLQKLSPCGHTQSP